jgi:hypothetical protein
MTRYLFALHLLKHNLTAEINGPISGNATSHAHLHGFISSPSHHFSYYLSHLFGKYLHELHDIPYLRSLLLSDEVEVVRLQ